MNVTPSESTDLHADGNSALANWSRRLFFSLAIVPVVAVGVGTGGIYTTLANSDPPAKEAGVVPPENKGDPSISVKDQKFQFEVIESHDAAYLGDTPAHMGRGGQLGTRRPNIALDDPVYRGDQLVGRVTHVRWDRPSDGLSLEFDPEPKTRVGVGEVVWVYLDGSAHPHRTEDTGRSAGKRE